MKCKMGGLCLQSLGRWKITDYHQAVFRCCHRSNQVRAAFEIGDTCRTSPKRFCFSPFARDGETTVGENVTPLAVFVHDGSMATSEWFHTIPERRYCPSAFMVDETLMSVAVFCDSESVDEWPRVGETARDGNFSGEIDISVMSLFIANCSESFGERGGIFPAGRKGTETFGIAESPKAVIEIRITYSDMYRSLTFIHSLSHARGNCALLCQIVKNNMSMSE